MYSVSINERVVTIKDDEEQINRFIEEYKPFIASCVESFSGRFVRYGEDDELSIALIAFVEAIKSYDSNKGNFLSFARNVMKRRLIDYYRKEKKHNHTISIHEYVGGEEDDEIDLSAGQAVDQFSKEVVSEYRRLELQELKKEISEYGISFMDLTEVSPKQTKTRKQYKDVILFLLSQNDLIKYIKTKKSLPIAEIEKFTGVPRKTIERARKYIIAVVIVMTGDYQYVKSYIDWGVIQ
ncbi:MAG: RNA polymerase sigma-I factor [Clostridia bacterium]|nr:RNA polymerase sigma-I factor [Clostridia bacterium]